MITDHVIEEHPSNEITHLEYHVLSLLQKQKNITYLLERAAMVERALPSN